MSESSLARSSEKDIIALALQVSFLVKKEIRKETYAFS